MQAKKRAKPVKFGKQLEKPSPKAEEVKEEAVKKAEPTHEENHHEPQPVNETEHKQQTVAADENKAEEKVSDDHTHEETTPEPSKETVETPAVVSTTQSSEKPAETPSPTPAAPTSGSSDLSATLSPVTAVSENKESTQPVQPQDENAFAYSPNTYQNGENGPKKKRNLLLYFLIVAFTTFMVGLAFMAGASYTMKDKAMLQSWMDKLPKFAQQAATPTPAAAPTEAPEKATPKPLDVSEYSIAVRNGSGITGAAGDLKAELDAAGYTVIASGNADRRDYAKTQLFVKKTVDKAFIEKLKELLSKKYELETESELQSSATSEPDVTIIIGKNPAN